MTNDQLTRFLGDLEKRLEVVALQAQKASDQARKAVALLNGLREEVGRLKQVVLSTTDTQEYEAARAPKKSPRK